MALTVQLNHLCLPLRGKFLVSAYDSEKGFWGKSQLIHCFATKCSADEELIVLCCAFSPCGKYFAVCLSKDLIVYSTTDWKSLCSVKTERKGVSVRFFPRSNIILIAEKSGHVKFFKFSDCEIEKINHTLGHNSMLMESLVTEDEKFVITCDRDEKIRVTNYPNCYNIQCYCLGHKRFVCFMDFLESDKNILISTSGDGTIRLWKISTGQELSMYALNAGETCNNFYEGANFFIKFTSFRSSKGESLIAALEHKSNCVTLLRVTGNLCSGINVNMHNVVKHNCTPWDIAVWQDKLVLLSPDETSPLRVYSSVNGDEEECNDSVKNISECLTLNWEMVSETYTKKNDSLPLLFQFKKENNMVDDRKEIKKGKYM